MRWLFPALYDRPRPRQIVTWVLTVITGTALIAMVSCVAQQKAPRDTAKQKPLNAHAKQDGYRLSMKLPTRLYDRTEDVRATVTVKNTSPKELPLHFFTSRHFDLAVLAQGGGEVFRWSQNRAFLQTLETKTLPPGGEVTEELVWPSDTTDTGTLRTPGAYTFVATSAAKELRSLEVRGDISLE